MDAATLIQLTIYQKNTGSVCFNLKGVFTFNIFPTNLTITNIEMTSYAVNINGCNIQGGAGEAITAKTGAIVAKYPMFGTCTTFFHTSVLQTFLT